MCSTVTCFIPTFRCAPRSYQTSLACADRAQLAIGSPAHVAVHRRSGIARANDLDVQVFRFTLGIPGFDDANIPRVIGTVGAGLLVLNHVLTAQPVPGTQVRAEVIGCLLMLLLLSLPTVETRLNDARSSIGRRAAAEGVPGAASLFAYDSSDSTVAKSLAWASFACLRNSTTCSILVVWKKRILLARGAFPQSCKPAEGSKVSTSDLESAFGEAVPAALLSSMPEEGLYMPTRQALSEQGLGSAGFLSEGIQSAFVVPLGPGRSGYMVVLSDFERSLGPKDRSWLLSLSRNAQLACAEL